LTLIIDVALCNPGILLGNDIQFIRKSPRKRKLNMADEENDSLNELVGDFCKQCLCYKADHDSTREFIYLCWQNFLIVNKHGSLYLPKEEFYILLERHYSVEIEYDCYLNMKAVILSR
jgi:hypothetical protein